MPNSPPQSQVLREGDEVGLLPPVSGGGSARSAANLSMEADRSPSTRVAPRASPSTRSNLSAAAKRGEDGAVVVFDGIVRNNSRGRQTLYLDYEAYEEMAAKQMHELADEARAALRRAPGDDDPSPWPAGGWRDQRADRRGFGASRARPSRPAAG